MLLHLIVILIYAAEVKSILYPIIYLNRLYNYTPPEDEVTFYLYERTNLYASDQLFIENKSSLDESKFNPELPTKIIVHGWTHGKDIPWVIEMREAMANVGIWNIIVVDWSPLSHVIYAEARIHHFVVSKQLANFLIFLKYQGGIPLSSVHLIGHSMGAQISATASYLIRSRLDESGEKVGRITGLDPAAPLYEWPHIESLDEVLDPSDATFVDVIHTNGRHIGMMTPAGHLDYYPNGGEHQEGCVFWSCSHMRACEFWTASIRKPHLFKAYAYESIDLYLEGKIDKLKSYPMGIAANPKIPFGLYYVKSRGEFRKYIRTKTTIIDSLNKM
ncbi:hypothetical protein NQ317_004466 [Molorchus minor]|uniref:Lipase domain-containing protein n=1 Tax=Molorchus minor TaxID=1323400 RepID=A0ABQ9JLE4_9CUCU|nr:hypothetical protein NQ317_004466 [Molorchus minor]